MTATRHSTICVVGSLNVDLVSYTSRIPNAGETLSSESFTTGFGGKGANQAVATARLAQSSQSLDADRVSVKMIGAVGDDEFGPSMKTAMEAQGVDVADVGVIPDQRTGVAVILVETSSGENRILINPGANATVLPPTLPEHLLVSSGTNPTSLIIMQLEIPLETVLHVCGEAKKSRIPVLLNPAPAVPLPEAIYKNLDVLIVNESEAAMLSGITFPDPNRSLSDHHAEYVNAAQVVAHWFTQRGCTRAVVTLGALGAVHSFRMPSKGRHNEVEGGYTPALKVSKVVDTTAAGDTFVGALATYLVINGSDTNDGEDGQLGNAKVLAEGVKYATRAAAWTVERRGTWDAMPASADLLTS